MLPVDTVWKVDTSGTDLETDWREPQFNDDTWDSVAASSPSMLITEISTLSTDYVEIQNVSGVALDTAGWFVVANNAFGVGLWHAALWYLPTDRLIAADEVLFRDDNGSDADHWGPDGIQWPSQGSGWVMIVDDAGHVVDFLAWGYSARQISDLFAEYRPVREYHRR